MTFEQWMEEMSKGTFFPKEGEVLSGLSKLCELAYEDLHEDELLSSS